MIRSLREWNAYRKRRDATIFRALQTGLEIALSMIISLIRAVTPVQTGNLQASVGVNRRVASARTKLGLRATPMKLLVKKAARGFVALLPIGMEYAPDVDRRTGFATNTVNGGEPAGIIRTQTDAALRYVERELGT